MGSQEPTASQRALRALFRQPNFMLGSLGLLTVIVLAVIAPYIAPHSPFQSNPALMLMPPGTPGHPLGTDELGRDILSRMLWGTRLTFGIGLLAATMAGVAGLMFGLVAAYRGGLTDIIVMRIVDVMMSFPYILLAIVIVAMLGPGLLNALFAVAILGTPFFIRVIRAEVLNLRTSDFVEAAKAIGASEARIMFRHLLPNIVTPFAVVFSLYVGYLIIAASGLSFLGLGAQPPAPEWGAMLATARLYVIVAPHVALIPGSGILILVLATNLVGEGVSEALDPRRRITRQC